MEKDFQLKIHYLNSIDSTQRYTKEQIKNKNKKPPFAVFTTLQTNGIGSRKNTWEGLEGNLFLSFAITQEELPSDLKLESASIYFSYLLKEVLQEYGSSVWIKWPNDFYIGESKIGGMITNLVDGVLICGVGINLVKNPKGFEKLDIEVDIEDLLKNYFKKVEKKVLWKQVFSKYKLEFYKNQNFSTHTNNLQIPLADASLQEDGSIVLNGERIYSLR
jgi:BirA family biotin operon repressor/biotin-[acetyl-CoA-carboxylase] ligase